MMTVISYVPFSISRCMESIYELGILSGSIINQQGKIDM